MTLTPVVKTEPHKVKCQCGWIGHEGMLDLVVDPHPHAGQEADQWVVCPHCRTPENIAFLCDHPGCLKTVECGTPTEDGYRHTCSEHAPRRDKL